MKLLIFSANSYRAATKVDSNGRPVKGRGIMVRLLFSYSLFDCFYFFFSRDILEKVVQDHVPRLIGVQQLKNVNVMLN
jgi:hypothetical protein